MERVQAGGALLASCSIYALPPAFACHRADQSRGTHPASSGGNGVDLRQPVVVAVCTWLDQESAFVSRITTVRSFPKARRMWAAKILTMFGASFDSNKLRSDDQIANLRHCPNPSSRSLPALHPSAASTQRFCTAKVHKASRQASSQAGEPRIPLRHASNAPHESAAFTGANL